MLRRCFKYTLPLILAGDPNETEMGENKMRPRQHVCAKIDNIIAVNSVTLKSSSFRKRFPISDNKSERLWISDNEVRLCGATKVLEKKKRYRGLERGGEKVRRATPSVNK